MNAREACERYLAAFGKMPPFTVGMKAGGEYAELLARSVERGEPISEREFDEFVKSIGPVDVAL